jgi:hypothetical protein
MGRTPNRDIHFITPQKRTPKALKTCPKGATPTPHFSITPCIYAIMQLYNHALRVPSCNFVAKISFNQCNLRNLWFHFFWLRLAAMGNSWATYRLLDIRRVIGGIFL